MAVDGQDGRLVEDGLGYDELECLKVFWLGSSDGASDYVVMGKAWAFGYVDYTLNTKHESCEDLNFPLQRTTRMLKLVAL